MPSPTPAVMVYSRSPITRIGLLEEPFLLVDEFRCTSRVVKRVDEGIEGDEIAISIGAVSATWSVEAKVLSQRGAADTHPGTRVSAGILENFDRPRFGISPSSGMLFFMGGELVERPGKLCEVSFTIDQHFIDRASGSPDSNTDDDLSYHGGGTNPGAGTTTNVAPYFTSIDTSLNYQVGETVSYTLTAGGTTPITYSVVTGYALPAGLSLNSSTGVISGTPTTVEEALVQFSASNTHGSARLSILLTVTAEDAPDEDPIVAYVRFLNTPDVGDPYYSCEAIRYDFGATDPLTVTVGDFLAEFSLETGSAIPLYDEDGVTEIGEREILEVFAVSSLDGVTGSAYHYRKSTTNDNLILAILRSGGDPVTALGGTVPTHVDSPSNPTSGTAAWPPLRGPDERILQYYVVENIRSGERFIGSTYSTTYASGAAFCAVYTITLAGHGTQPVKLAPTERDYWKLRELVDSDGTSIYSDAGYTVCEDLITDGKSPRIYGPSVDAMLTAQPGVLYSGSAGQTVPSILSPSGYSLPSPIGTVAPWLSPDSTITTYVLLRNAITGKFVAYGFADDYFQNGVGDWYNGFTAGSLTYSGFKPAASWYWTDVATGFIIVEIFRKGASIADESGDGYLYIHASQSTDRRIERILSHGYTPVGHALCGGSAVGALYIPV